MRRVLFFTSTTGYQTRMFGEAAARLGVSLMFATDRCDQLSDPWGDRAIAVRFDQHAATRAAIDAALRDVDVHGVLAVGDRPTVAAAETAERLGLPGHPPDAARAARDKRLTRDRLRAAGLHVPALHVVPRTAEAWALDGIPLPVVVKPAVLSGSRGVIRADTPDALAAAVARVNRILEAEDVRALRDSAADLVLIERFVPGREYALEGVLERGELRTLAVFDKPDPLDGPFFEETIYVTPSRAATAVQDAIRDTVARAAHAIGLWHGPIHAECRVNGDGVHVLEVAARPIGGLCARALAFERRGERAGLEEVLLRHACGEPVGDWSREAAASGVMMMPIPMSGVFRRVDGVKQAAAVAGIEAIEITAKADQQLLALPEGASYLGFIFARAATAAEVEGALREAHARLTMVIERAVPLAT